MRPHARLTRAYAFTFLATCVLASGATGQTSQTGNASNTGIDLTSIDIENFGRVNERYYRGAQPDHDDYTDLAAIGIRTLINLTGDDAEADEQALVEGAGMKYLQIPMTTHEQPTLEKVAAFLRIVNDPAHQPVYVHCVGGRHRTGVMTAVYRMAQDGWTADQAFDEMKRYKFGAAFLHPEFKEFVYRFRTNPAYIPPGQAVVEATKPVR